MVHDFDIGHPRFSFDAYDGVACGPGLLGRMSRPPGRYFILDPAAVLPLPCLQTGRRAGVAAITAGLDDRPLDGQPVPDGPLPEPGRTRRRHHDRRPTSAVSC